MIFFKPKRPKAPRTATRYRPLTAFDSPRKLGEAPRAALGPTLNVVCWNMYKARNRGWLEDIAAVADNSDLVLLQEAVLHDNVPHAFHLSSGLEWYMSENLGDLRRKITTGPKTGSRAPAISAHAVRTVDKEIIGTPKSMLVTRYPFAPAGAPSDALVTLLVVNVHAINVVSTRKFARHVEQMVAAVKDHEGPVLVGGDFNTWNKPRRMLLWTAMMTLGLKHAPIDIPPRLGHLNQILDHVFYRGLNLLGAHPMLQVRSSDHIPLRLEFDSTPSA